MIKHLLIKTNKDVSYIEFILNKLINKYYSMFNTYDKNQKSFYDYFDIYYDSNIKVLEERFTDIINCLIKIDNCLGTYTPKNDTWVECSFVEEPQKNKCCETAVVLELGLGQIFYF